MQRVVAVMLVSLVAAAARGQCPAGPMTSLFWMAGASSRQTGIAVDMTGLATGELLMLTGDNFFGPGNFNFTGAGFVFRGTPDGLGGYAWAEEAMLRDVNAANGDFFGSAVSIFAPESGPALALVAAQLDDAAGSNAGSVAAFRREAGGTWIQETLLVAPDAAANDNFGRSAALAANLALIGSPEDDDGAGSSGSAYVFERVEMGMSAEWIMRSKLVAPVPTVNDRLGSAVAITDDWAFAGAPLDNQAASDAGAVHVFRRTPDGMGGSSWVFHSKLLAPDAAASDQFGAALSAADGVLVVGALFGGAGETGTGYAFRLEVSGMVESWVFESAVTPNPGEATSGDRCGSAVAYRDGLALLGASEDDDGGTNTGSAFLFRRTIVAGTPAWGQASKIRLPTPMLTDDFGFAVGLARGWAAIGSPAHNQYGTDKGNTFVFAAPAPPVILTGPTDESLASGNTLVLSAEVGGRGPWAYQWYFGETALMNGGRVSGADGAVLTITDMQTMDAGSYRVEATNSCGVSAAAAMVTVSPPPHCTGDANGDGEVNFADVTSVLAFFGFDYTPGTGMGDASGDGPVNFADVTAVLSAWGVGCP